MNAIFNAKSLSKKCEAEYIKRYFPNNAVLDHNDYTEKYNLKKISYNSLENHEFFGMPYAVDRNKDGMLSVTFQEAAHTLVVGTTQVGKSWGHAMDSIYALSAKKNRPCFMITDPKGEIMENTATMLKEKGYKIFALNFKDSTHSNMWNPLLEIYDSWIQLKDIEVQPKYHNSLKDLTKYELEDSLASYKEEGCFWSIKDKAYSSLKEAQSNLEQQRAEINNRTADLVNQLVSSLSASFIEKSKEPIWELGALKILKGLIYVLLEDALAPDSGFTRENMNFMNMYRYYEIIREGAFADTATRPLIKIPKLWHKKNTDYSIRHMKPELSNAPNTSRSYAGVFENIMQDWFNPKIYSVTNGNNINLDNYEKEPFAVFLVTRDYEKSDYFIAGLFIDWMYKEMLAKAEASDGKLKREMYFILDEFGNVPTINSFTNKISTSLSRRIIFQLYVQSYEQIEANYGTVDAGTIRANCNVEVFLGSQSHQTKEEFSKSCGSKLIQTAESSLTPDKKATMAIPLLPVSELENLSRGEAYVRRLNKPTSKTHYEMAYTCAEFMRKKCSAQDLGIVSPSYANEMFVYKYLYDDRPMSLYGKNKYERETGDLFIYNPD